MKLGPNEAIQVEPTHGLRFEVNCSLLFTELPILDRPAAARRAGFEAIEMYWPFLEAVPSDIEVDRFVSAVGDAGVRLVALNFFAGDLPSGDRGIVSWPGREQELRESAEVAVAIGGRLGCRRFNALYGNRLEGVEEALQDEVAVDNLHHLSLGVSGLEGVVLLEALSGVDRYPLKTAADAMAVVRRGERLEHPVGPSRVCFLADLYHLTVNGEDLGAVIEEHSWWTGHVQIADAPGRHEPGTGNIDLDRFLVLLEDAGYRGWVGIEYLPTGTTEESLSWLPRHRRSLGGAYDGDGGLSKPGRQLSSG